MLRTLIVVLMLLPFSNASAAVDLKALIAEMLAQQKVLGEMQVESKAAKDEEAGLGAEAKRITSVQKRVQREGTEWQMANGENERLKASWSAMGCVANQRTTDVALATRCNELADRINKETVRLETWGQRLIQEQRQSELDQTALSTKTLENAARQKQAIAAVNDLTRRINAIKAFLTSRCNPIPASASDEAVKHGCGNITFDGAAPALPPLRNRAVQAVRRGTEEALTSPHWSPPCPHSSATPSPSSAASSSVRS